MKESLKVMLIGVKRPITSLVLSALLDIPELSVWVLPDSVLYLQHQLDWQADLFIQVLMDDGSCAQDCCPEDTAAITCAGLICSWKNGRYWVRYKNQNANKWHLCRCVTREQEFIQLLLRFLRHECPLGHRSGGPMPLSFFEHESKLIHDGKMEILGRLASSVAHDMNNILASILLSADLAESAFGAPKELERALVRIRHAAERGRSLTSKVLSFSRKSTTVFLPFNMNELLNRCIESIELPKVPRILFVKQLQEDLPEIHGDQTALEGVFQNLIGNAIDAMPEGGELTLFSRHSTEESIEVGILDSGVGMSEAVLRQATEPFFTTKAEGLGTGLGLAIVHGTVKAHRGTMELASSPGVGTRVSITLPLSPLHPKSPQRSPRP